MGVYFASFLIDKGAQKRYAFCALGDERLLTGIFENSVSAIRLSCFAAATNGAHCLDADISESDADYAVAQGYAPAFAFAA